LLGDTISVVIWEWERNYAIPTSGSHFRRIRLYNTYMPACDRSKQVLLYILRFMLRRNGLNRERWSYPRSLMVIPSAVRIYTSDHCITSKHTNYKSSHFTHRCLPHIMSLSIADITVPLQTPYMFITQTHQHDYTSTPDPIVSHQYHPP
jgi:hypothetical protein